MAATWLRRIAPFVGVALFVMAVVVLHRLLSTVDLATVHRVIDHGSPWRFLLAGALTVAGYLVLLAIDVAACRHAGRRLRWTKVAMASFIGHAFTHTLGNALLVGGSVRYRLYSLWGLSVRRIAAVVIYCFASFWLGFCALAGVVSLITTTTVPAHSVLSRLVAAAPVLLVVPALWWMASWGWRRPFRLGPWRSRMPHPTLAFIQMAAGAAELALRSLVLWVLISASLGVGYGAFLAAYLLAMVAGKASQVPGGLGVVEGTLLVLLPRGDAGAMLGGLVLYRLVYYVGPLLAAALLLGGVEMLERRAGMHRTIRHLAGWFAISVRQVMAGCTVLAAGTVAVGSMLSSVMPPHPPVLHGSGLGWWLSEVAPPASAALAIVLLLAARGLQRRLHAGWTTAVIACLLGLVLGVVEGTSAIALGILSAVLLSLIPCRTEFHRRTTLLAVDLMPGWVACVALLIGVSSSVVAVLPGFPSPSRWPSVLGWSTLISDDSAARALRALLAELATVVVMVALRAWHPQARQAPPPSRADLAQASRLIAAGASPSWAAGRIDDLARGSTCTTLRLLFSEAKDAVLLYRIDGRDWIALGDPLGSPGQRQELIWRFGECCDAQDGRPLVLAVSDPAPYADLGLSPLAIGEEAHLRLRPAAGRDPAGVTSQAIGTVRERHSATAPAAADRPIDGGNGCGDGLTFRVVSGADLAPWRDAIAAVEQTWQGVQKHRAGPLLSTSASPMAPAVLLHRQGELIACASLRLGQNGAVELERLRYTGEAPPQLLRLIIEHTMRWAAGQDYDVFSFGLIPLSGVDHRLGSGEQAMVGAPLFAHGEHFTTTSALRAFVEGFHPRWSPRWLCTRAERDLPSALRAILPFSATAEVSARLAATGRLPPVVTGLDLARSRM